MDQQYSSQPLLDLEIDPSVTRSFHNATSWARFIAIVYSIILGIFLIIIIALAAGGAFYDGFMSTLQDSPVVNVLGKIFLIVLSLCAVVGVFLLVLLFKFIIYTNNGLTRQEQSTFNSGLKSLKNYFLIQGILSLLYLAFVAILTVTGLFTSNI